MLGYMATPWPLANASNSVMVALFFIVAKNASGGCVTTKTQNVASELSKIKISLLSKNQLFKLTRVPGELV